jgi:cytochrome c-type biogenesis protein
MPDLQAAYEDFSDEIDFIGVQQVGLDTRQDGINFLNEVGVTYPNLVDEGLRIQSAYQVFAYPTTIFLDSNHDIFRTWSGPLTEDNLRDLIESVIAG